VKKRNVSMDLPMKKETFDLREEKKKFKKTSNASLNSSTYRIKSTEGNQTNKTVNESIFTYIKVPKPQTLERLNGLYSKGLEKNEKYRIIYQEKEKLRKVSEMEKCTFKPKINKDFHFSKTTQAELNVNDRTKNWQTKKAAK
jgi:hypothetical protein